MPTPLTEETKLDILKQAIRAGADIKIILHVDHTDFTPSLEETCKPFEVMTRRNKSVKGFNWMSFYEEGDEYFRACVYYPVNYPLPKEWVDVGDAGEGSA